jgi:hypothetical protein
MCAGILLTPEQVSKLFIISRRKGFSHMAVVKHLTPESYVERLLVRPDLIQRSRQFHFRPFNGHHCQLPVTRADGSLTREISDWLPLPAQLFVLGCLETRKLTTR